MANNKKDVCSPISPDNELYESDASTFVSQDSIPETCTIFEERQAIGDTFCMWKDVTRTEDLWWSHHFFYLLRTPTVSLFLSFFRWFSAKNGQVAQGEKSQFEIINLAPALHTYLQGLGWKTCEKKTRNFRVLKTLLLLKECL